MRQAGGHVLANCAVLISWGRPGPFCLKNTRPCPAWHQPAQSLWDEHPDELFSLMLPPTYLPSSSAQVDYLECHVSGAA